MAEFKRLELRLPPAFWEQLKKRAKANERSLHGEILHLLKQAIVREEILDDLKK